MKITINSTLEGFDIPKSEAIINGIFRTTPLMISMISSFVISILLLFYYGRSENVASLILAIITLSFCIVLPFFLSYTKKVRSILHFLLHKKIGKEFTYEFSEDGIDVYLYGEKIEHYDVEQMLGHYITKDYYVLYVSNEIKKDVLIIKISDENNDDVNTVVHFFKKLKKLDEIYINEKKSETKR